MLIFGGGFSEIFSRLKKAVSGSRIRDYLRFPVFDPLGLLEVGWVVLSRKLLFSINLEFTEASSAISLSRNDSESNGSPGSEISYFQNPDDIEERSYVDF